MPKKKFVFDFPSFDGGLRDFQDARTLKKDQAVTVMNCNQDRAGVTGYPNLSGGVSAAPYVAVDDIIQDVYSIYPEVVTPGPINWKLICSKDANLRAHGGHWPYVHNNDGDVSGVLFAASDWSVSQGYSNNFRHQMAQLWYGKAGVEVHYEITQRGSPALNYVTNGGTSGVPVSKVGLDHTSAMGVDTSNPGNITGSIKYGYANVFEVCGGMRVIGRLREETATVMAAKAIKLVPNATGSLPSHVSCVDCYLYRYAPATEQGDNQWHWIASLGAAPDGVAGVGTHFKREGSSDGYSDNVNNVPFLRSAALSPYHYAVPQAPSGFTGMTVYKGMAVGWKVNATGGPNSSAIYFTWPDLIQMWDPTFKVSVNGEVFQAIEMDGVLHVFTSDGVWRVTGTSETGDLASENLQGAPPAINGSAARGDGGIYYLSKQGFMFLPSGSGTPINLTQRNVLVEGSTAAYVLAPNAVTTPHRAIFALGQYYCSARYSGSVNPATGIVYIADVRNGPQNVRWSKVDVGVSAWYYYTGTVTNPQNLWVQDGYVGAQLMSIWGQGSKRSMTYRTGDRELSTGEPFILKQIRINYTIASGETLTITPILDGNRMDGSVTGYRDARVTLSTLGTEKTVDAAMPQEWGRRLSLEITGTGTVYRAAVDVVSDSFGRF